MRVFLAGGTGHVGGGILAELLRQGHEATVLARHPPRVPLGTKARFLSGDLGEPDAWQDSLAGHDVCVQAAGLIRNRGANTFQHVLVEGTRHLVAACRKHGVARFVLISASGVDESMTPYQRAKLEAEKIVKDSGLPHTIFRPNIVFGPTDDFTNRFARMMRWGLLPYPGRGAYRLAPVALWDLAPAVVRSLSTAAAINRTFHVCGPESIAYKDLLASVRAAAGRRALLVPTPVWTMKIAGALLSLLPTFPGTPDAIRMLVRGNECPEQDWHRLLHAQPTPFSEGIQRYLARRRPM